MRCRATYIFIYTPSYLQLEINSAISNMYKGDIMKISEQVRVLKVTENNSTIYPTLLIDDKDIILIDTGYPTSLTAFKKAIENEGFSLSQITKIFLTHQDWDHIGGVNLILKEVPTIKVYANILEKPYIEGSQVPIKVMALKEQGKEDEFLANKQKFTSLYCHIDETFKGGEILGNTIKIQVIHTPGHTIGHTSFYLPETKTFIAGDALFNDNGVLIGSRPIFTQDKKQAIESLKPLVLLPIDKIVCYHGGIYDHHCNERIAEIINN